jgi:homocysteine S-methyltransferase
VTAVTVADNPLASACMDNLVVAGLISRHIGCAVIPHLVGRDRNRIALQSYLMGAHATGIRSVLCITGDPVRMYNETNTKGVFDVTSVGLVKLVNEFNQGQRSGDGSKSAFAIGVALNPNVRTLSGQIDLLKRKVDAGAHFALTQPVFAEKRIVDLRAALDAAGLSIPIFIGILPLVSSRNAEFLHNEVPGISIPEEIRKRLASFQDPADQRRAACDLAAAFVSRLAPHSRDFYFITPRNKVDLVLPLIQIARACPAMNDGLKSRDRQ